MADNVTPYIYFPIKTSFLRSENLSVYEKAMFMVLLTYKRCKTIYPSQTELAKHAGMSRFQAIKVLDSLAVKGYITKDNKTNHKTTVYRILNKALVNVVDTDVNESDNDVNESDTTCQRQQQVPVNEIDTNKEKVNKENIINKKEEKKKTVAAGKDLAKDKIPYKEILDYLNSKAQLPRGFKPSNGSNKFISGRWNEGFRVPDFKTVIDNKVTEWLGDPKWGKFLRPETLFGTKFESYLNQPEKKKKEETDYGMFGR
jgi:uncharacterized phage protein (TIGR02220 family)